MLDTNEPHTEAQGGVISRTRYTEEFKAEAVKQVTERGHAVVDVAARLGFELVYVTDMPHSARSVTDLENGRIYLPPASIPGVWPSRA